ncbi:hypothetical protein HK102_011591, partial [Quaeritorhiza haematococci]
MDPFVELVEFKPRMKVKEDNLVAVREARVVCQCHGNDAGTLLEIAHACLFSDVIGNPSVMEKLKEVASKGAGT